MTEPPAKKLKMESEGTPEKKSPTTSPSPEPDSVAPATSSPPTPAKYTRGDLVTLLVGPEEQELVVCGTPLAKTSEFFRIALKKEWKEGQVRVVKLPEEDINLITRYLDFVFSQILPSGDVQDASQVEDTCVYYGILKLYTLGERILDGSIRNAVVKETLRLADLIGDDGCGLLPCKDCIEMIYKETSERSAARCVMVDLHVAYGTSTFLEEGNVLPEYMCDLAKAYNKKIENDERIRRTFPRITLKAEDYLV
jgi:hypothetical protein